MAEITRELISAIDISDMFEVLGSFPAQVRKAMEIGRATPSFEKNVNRVLFLGMGGSAIGGDLLRSFFEITPGASHLQVTVNRNYDIPGWVNESTLVIASSYSGNTEETISGVRQALGRTPHIVCITTGGELEQIASSNGKQLIKLPTGLMPRCAIGYSFFSLLGFFRNSSLLGEEAKGRIDRAQEETMRMLEKRASEFMEINPGNKAIALAEKVHGRIPVIYSTSDRLDAVNLRWKGQVQENAKCLAFGSLLPEMNHNEINAWQQPEELQDSFIAILLYDEGNHERNKLRLDILGRMLDDAGRKTVKLHGEGEYLMTRTFDLIYLGDWFSYYLALKYGTDPTPVPIIMTLKDKLAAGEL